MVSEGQRFFTQNFLSESLNCSFFMSKMSDSLTLLISSERPEAIAHNHSFPLSDLSDSLTGAYMYVLSNLSISLTVTHLI